jgi:hypothetical protein
MDRLQFMLAFVLTRSGGGGLLDCQEGDCYSVRNPPTWAIELSSTDSFFLDCQL